MTVVETGTQQYEDSVDGPERVVPVGHLRVLTGAAPHPAYPVEVMGLSIGRAGGECEVLVDDVRMSRKHARIERSITGWRIQDLQSRNGVFVDGRGFGGGGAGAAPRGGGVRPR